MTKEFKCTEQDYIEYPYTIEATNIQGAIALDFIGRHFKTMKGALEAFDRLYTRKGFQIVIFKSDPERCYERVVARIVKSTFR